MQPRMDPYSRPEWILVHVPVHQVKDSLFALINI